MNDRHQLDDCLELMYALMQYRHEPVNRRLHKMGKRESMLHTDALQLIYHLARIWHFLAMCGFLAFIPGHLIMVVLHGWNNFYSMLAGWKRDPEYLQKTS